jgi:hypothetical protein
MTQDNPAGNYVKMDHWAHRVLANGQSFKTDSMSTCATLAAYKNATGDAVIAHFGSLQTGVNAALDVANNAPAIQAVINGVGGVWTYWVVTNENHPISAQRVAAIQVAFPLAQQGPNHWGVSLTRNGGVTTVGYLDR